MQNSPDLHLNKAAPNIMWIDLNSAFATTEQQAHPSLRGKPVGITNRISQECCIIAASYEAKAKGVKVGCRRSEAMRKCPNLVLLETDPPKYHYVYFKLLNIMKTYTDNVKMKSIDEGILDFNGTAFQDKPNQIIKIAREIKRRIKDEIGDYITINIGIAPNRFLAKTAAGLNKPDGLDIITHENLLNIYEKLELEDLTGIASKFGFRLRINGIKTPLDFLNAREEFLRKVVFKSINGNHWYKKLRGYETDNYKTNLGMVGRQWVVDGATSNEEYLKSCLHFLTETVAIKLRYREREAFGVCIWLRFSAGGGYSNKKMYKTSCFSDKEIWRRVAEAFSECPKGRKVKMIGIYLYKLVPSSRNQPDLFGEKIKEENLTTSIDSINKFYGIFSIHSADSLTGAKKIKQKIPFGGTEYFNLLLKK